MKDDEKERCLCVIDEILNHDIYKIVGSIESDCEKKDDVQNYFDLIKKRLNNHEFEKVSDFFGEIDQIFLNFRQKNSSNDHHQIVADELQKHVKKNIYRFNSMNNFVKILKLRNKLFELFTKTPFPPTESGINPSLPIAPQLIKSDEVKQLSNAMELIKESDDVSEINEYMSRLDITLDYKRPLYANTLKPNVYKGLEEKVKSILQKRNIDYNMFVNKTIN